MQPRARITSTSKSPSRISNLDRAKTLRTQSNFKSPIFPCDLRGSAWRCLSSKATALVFLTGIKDAATGEDYFYFEVPFAANKLSRKDAKNAKQLQEADFSLRSPRLCATFFFCKKQRCTKCFSDRGGRCQMASNWTTPKHQS